MKTITDIIFPKKFKTEAEEYIAYKRSLGFKFSMDDQRKLLYMLNHIYIHNHNLSINYIAILSLYICYVRLPQGI